MVGSRKTLLTWKFISFLLSFQEEVEHLITRDGKEKKTDQVNI